MSVFISYSSYPAHTQACHSYGAGWPKISGEKYWHSINFEWSRTAAVVRYICSNWASGYLKLIRDR